MAKKISLVQTPLPPSSIDPAVMVGVLEEFGGNLERFVKHFYDEQEKQEDLLFGLYLHLNKPENAELNQRWKFALRLSATLRMDLLRCKAFTKAETFENKSSTSSAPDVAFFRTLLQAPLVEESERIKYKYRPAPIPGQPAPHEKEADEMDELDSEFDKAAGG